MTDNLPTTETQEARPPSMVETMFSGLMDMVRDPEVSPEKMAAMLDVQERLLDRQERMDFNAAHRLATADMPRIDKNGRIINHKTGELQSRYARLEDIDRIVRPICNRHGLSYSWDIGVGERGASLVTCILSHAGGHERRYGPMSLPADTSGAKNATQGAGSSVKYGQRYTLCAALNIQMEGADDDGQGARTKAVPELGFNADELLDQAQIAGSQGSKAYAEFFQGLSPMRKGWLVESGHHENIKSGAAVYDPRGE
jgi:hypothetical protein